MIQMLKKCWINFRKSQRVIVTYNRTCAYTVTRGSLSGQMHVTTWWSIWKSSLLNAIFVANSLDKKSTTLTTWATNIQSTSKPRLLKLVRTLQKFKKYLRFLATTTPSKKIWSRKNHLLNATKRKILCKLLRASTKDSRSTITNF